MVVLNGMDRYRLALDAISRVPRFGDQVGEAAAMYTAAIGRHRTYIREHGEDLPEVRDWRWSGGLPPSGPARNQGDGKAASNSPASASVSLDRQRHGHRQL